MAANQIGRYLLKGELGRGGMATVFLAHDPRMSRDVAVKVLPQQFTHDPQFLGRFEREARVIASLEHPAIVPVYDFGEEGDRPYLVMRYMSGGSLADRIKSGPITLDEASIIITRIALALDEAHGRGMIHRDLKPGNIMFDDRGDAYLSDFGIVKLAESTDTYTGSGIVGTPAYISPEQVHGDQVLDGRSDIYSLGIILFQMLTGRAPYLADTPGKMMMAHVMEPVPNILAVKSDLPTGCSTIIVKSMAKERDDRYPTAGQMAADLIAVTENRIIAPPPSELSQTEIARPELPRFNVAVPPRQAKKRTWVWFIGGGLILLLMVICGATILFGVFRGILPTSPGTEEVATKTATSTPQPSLSPSQPPLSPSQPTATDTRLSTPTLSETPLPESSPTVIPSPTIAEVTDVPNPEVSVEFSSINVRSGPGANFDVVAIMVRGERALVIARTQDSTWFNIFLEDDVTGWVSASVVSVVEGNRLEDIPIAATIPPPPVSLPTPTPSVAPYGASSFSWMDPFYEANQSRRLTSNEILKPLAQFSTLLLLLTWVTVKWHSRESRLRAVQRLGLLMRLLTLLFSFLGVSALFWIIIQ